MFLCTLLGIRMAMLEANVNGFEDKKWLQENN